MEMEARMRQGALEGPAGRRLVDEADVPRDLPADRGIECGIVGHHAGALDVPVRIDARKPGAAEAQVDPCGASL